MCSSDLSECEAVVFRHGSHVIGFGIVEHGPFDIVRDWKGWKVTFFGHDSASENSDFHVDILCKSHVFRNVLSAMCSGVSESNGTPQRRTAVTSGG